MIVFSFEYGRVMSPHSLFQKNETQIEEYVIITLDHKVHSMESSNL
jgi:hypothetical protein